MTNKNRDIKVFIDFDGTISTVDVGEEIFLRFGDSEEANRIFQLWATGKITSVQTWQKLFATLTKIDETKFYEFLDEIEIDPYFTEYIEHLRENNIDHYILSDGMDLYIKRILAKYNLSDIPYYSNKLELKTDGTFELAFPHRDEECINCANCKRNHIINHSSDEDFTIYVGDGYSDVCPAQHCDFVFAKNSLLKYCEKNNITFHPYSSFKKVLNKTKELQTKKNLKKKHQAELKRREAYIQG